MIRVALPAGYKVKMDLTVRDPTVVFSFEMAAADFLALPDGDSRDDATSIGQVWSAMKESFNALTGIYSWRVFVRLPSEPMLAPPHQAKKHVAPDGFTTWYVLHLTTPFVPAQADAPSSLFASNMSL